jgi:hypothetical protein
LDKKNSLFNGNEPLFTEKDNGIISIGSETFSGSYQMFQYYNGSTYVEITAERYDYFLNYLMDHKLIEKFEIRSGNFLISLKNAVVTKISSDSKTSIIEANMIEFKYIQAEIYNEIRFGLVNFISDNNFFIDVSVFNGYHQINSLTSIEFEQAADYTKYIEYLNRSKSVTFTSFLSIKMNTTLNLDTVFSVASNICTLLSIAQGRKIGYIFYEYKNSNILLNRTIVKNLTMQFGTKNVISHEPNELKQFLESCYCNFVSLKTDSIIDRGIIDVLCQAKISSSLLEMKGLMLTTFVEILKTNIRTFIETKPTKQLTIDFLKWIKTTNEKNKKLEKIDFSFFIEFIVIFSKMKDDQPERKEFVNQRNSLTHEGKFCDSQKKGYQYGKNNSKEKLSRYLFVENFINKLILGLLNYNGNFMERSYDNSAYYEQNVPFTNFLNP